MKAAAISRGAARGAKERRGASAAKSGERKVLWRRRGAALITARWRHRAAKKLKKMAYLLSLSGNGGMAWRAARAWHRVA